MISSRPQRTISRPVAVRGRGYWSGQRVRVEFRPADPGTGLAFVRDDLPGKPRVQVDVSSARPASRRTVLSVGPAEIEMVEHVLASLYGVGVDNCEIGVDASEMPGCDGSATEFVAALDRAGYTEQPAFTHPIYVDRPFRCGGGDQWIEMRPSIGGGLSIEYHLDYGPNSPIGTQWFVLNATPGTFRSELCAARTFVLKEEAEALRAQGLAGHVSPTELLIFGPDGPIDNELRWPDECVRHKVLDVLGDLALVGRPIAAHVVAFRSGHLLNGELAGALSNAYCQEHMRKSA